MDYSLRVTILQIFDLLKVLASSCTYKYTHTHNLIEILFYSCMHYKKNGPLRRAKSAAKAQKVLLKVHLTFSGGCYCGGNKMRHNRSII